MAYKKIEQYDAAVTEGLMKSYHEAIKLIGENPELFSDDEIIERVFRKAEYLWKDNFSLMFAGYDRTEITKDLNYDCMITR